MLYGAFLRLETAETALKRMEEKRKEKEELRRHIKMIRAAQSVTKEWSEAVNAKKQQRTAAETLEKAAADLPVKEKAKAEAEQALALFEKENPKQKSGLKWKGEIGAVSESFPFLRDCEREAERLVGIYAVKQKEAERLREQVSAAEKKSGGRQKELALPKPDFHGRTSFCTGRETDRRTALPRMRIAFSSCTCRGGRGQDNGKRCEGRGTADAPVGRRGEKIRHEAEAYQAKDLAAAKESADKAMTVLSELEKNLPAAYRDSLALEKEIKIWKPVFHPLKNHWSRRKKSEKTRRPFIRR